MLPQEKEKPLHTKRFQFYTQIFGGLFLLKQTDASIFSLPHTEKLLSVYLTVGHGLDNKGKMVRLGNEFFHFYEMLLCLVVLLKPILMTLITRNGN